MAPNYVTPQGAIGIILVEHVVDTIVVHWSIWIVDPVLGGLEVVGGPVPLADDGGDLLGLRVEEDSPPIAAADEEAGGEENKEEEEGP